MFDFKNAMQRHECKKLNDVRKNQRASLQYQNEIRKMNNALRSFDESFNRLNERKFYK